MQNIHTLKEFLTKCNQSLTHSLERRALQITRIPHINIVYYFPENQKMHMLDQHPMYPYTAEEKQEIRKEFGFKESILEEDIDAILEWYYKQPHLAEAPINRDYVERVFIATKGSREKAKRRIDNFYKYKSQAPELVQTRKNILLDPDTVLWTFFRQAAMLKLYKGKRISVFKITDPDPSSFINEEIFRNTIMLADLRMKYDYMIGDMWILDLENVTFGHILRVNPTLMQKFVNILQDGTGIKLFEAHIINTGSFTQHLVTLFKQFAKPKIMDRLMFHESIDQLQNYIPKSYLPKDYGGNQPSLDEFKDMYTKELRKDLSRNYLIECCLQISDEQKRPETFKEEYLVGSFKQLGFD